MSIQKIQGYFQVNTLEEYLIYRQVMKKIQNKFGEDYYLNQNQYVQHHGKIYLEQQLKVHILSCKCNQKEDEKNQKEEESDMKQSRGKTRISSLQKLYRDPSYTSERQKSRQISEGYQQQHNYSITIKACPVDDENDIESCSVEYDEYECNKIQVVNDSDIKQNKLEERQLSAI